MKYPSPAIKEDIEMESNDLLSMHGHSKSHDSSLDESFGTMELLQSKWTKKGKDRVVCN